MRNSTKIVNMGCMDKFFKKYQRTSATQVLILIFVYVYWFIELWRLDLCQAFVCQNLYVKMDFLVSNRSLSFSVWCVNSSQIKHIVNASRVSIHKSIASPMVRLNKTTWPSICYVYQLINFPQYECAYFMTFQERIVTKSVVLNS